MGAPSVTVDRTALLKIVLHAAKYPTVAVNGVLIGTVQQGGAGSSATSPRSGPTVHIYDAIPLCHTFITLTPVLECALVQVAEHVRHQKGGVRVVGYYQCNERFNDSDLSGPGKKIADRIEQLYPDSVAVVLDSAVLQQCLAGKSERPLLLLHAKDGPRGWVAAGASGGGSGGQFTCPTGGVRGLVEQYTAEGRHRKLTDFEDHLQDITRDWLNPDLLS